MIPALAHVESWIFDLDNCLYPASTDLFGLIDVRMGEYIQRLLACDPVEARAVQKRHFLEHGTTLAGLMRTHNVDPREFLDFVHDIDLARIAADPALVAALDRLPGRKFVFTNASDDYAGRVLDQLGLANAFDGMHDIHAMNYAPKPDPASYRALCDRFGIEPARAIFIEDMARNLIPAKTLGMTTVWVDNGSEKGGHDADPEGIDFITHDVGVWLTEVITDLNSTSLPLRGRLGWGCSAFDGNFGGRAPSPQPSPHRGEGAKWRKRMTSHLQIVIEAAWERREALEPGVELGEAVGEAIRLLDSGAARVAEPGPDGWTVNQWLKKAVLLSFRLNPMAGISGGPGGAHWWDKVPSKFAGWSDAEFEAAGFRAVPGAIVRRGAYVAKGAVLMPSFVNIGAYVGEGTMIDTWATVGSCAQIGRNVHISGGTGIGGVLEPLQAGPVIVEDDCFIGARSEVAEGVIVEQGAVISMGVFLGASTKIVDRATGEVIYGRVPAYSVVVPGTLPARDGDPSLACAVIVKRVDAKTRSKTGINELLRD